MPGFIQNAYKPFTKNKEKTLKFKGTGDSRNIYRKKPDKTCCQHDMAYEDYEDLTKGTIFDKILLQKAFNIAKNSKYDGYQRGFVSMVYQCFDKKIFYHTRKEICW